MGLLERLFGRKRSKTTPRKEQSNQTSISIVATYPFKNLDIIYGIKKLDNNLYAAVIKEYPPRTIKKMLQGKPIHVKPPYPIEHVVEVGPEVNVKYKEIGAFSPWPKPITRESSNTDN